MAQRGGFVSGKMKKYKVVNKMFFRAGHSFSDLSMYYRHVVSQLRSYADGIKEAGKEREEAEKERGRVFDKQGQENFERVFAEIWPGYFHNSFLTSACSQFEHEVKNLCAIIQEEHKMPRGLGRYARSTASKNKGLPEVGRCGSAGRPSQD
jgi:hypothetical protein